LTGGVGNQLFQYAAGRKLATERDAPLHVLHSPEGATRSLTLRDLLGVPPPALDPKLRFVCGLRNAWLGAAPQFIQRPVRSALRRRVGYHELHQSLMQMADRAPTVDDRWRVLHLTGFFQHPSFYEPVLKEVLSEIAANVARACEPARGDGVVAVHFRRGDYLLHGYALPFGYQERALELITSKTTVSRVVVLSDDDDFGRLAADHLARGGVPATAVDTAAGSDADDFRILATAQHVVMSNSTFAWWAAAVGDALRPAGDRLVACPVPWMPATAEGRIPAAKLSLLRAGWLSVPGWTNPPEA
jgi:glycosyl transferase family 11